MTTKTAQFTPGPWNVHIIKDNGNWIYQIRTVAPHNPAGGLGKHIATVNAHIQMTHNNASLIAAAPAMYEACQWALSTLTDNDDDALNETDKATIELLRQALAQAEGK